MTADHRPTRAITGSTSAAIAGSVEDGVRHGTLPPGTRLPTVRALSDRLGVSTATVSDAYRALRLRGVIRTDGRRGSKVAELPPVATSWTPAPPPPGLRNLADGNPDRRLLPSLGRLLSQAAPDHALYGDPPRLPQLVEVAVRDLRADGVPADEVAVVGGAIDGIGRVLQAHLAPGDRVAVEDPTFPPLLNLVATMGLVPVGMALDGDGPVPQSVHRALDRGVAAVIVTPRAQNPTGALLGPDRVRELRRMLGRHPRVLLIEDDTGGLIGDDPLVTLTDPAPRRWAFVRSFSMVLGPDIRTAVLAGDPVTLSRVQGRQVVTTGWVSHILQNLAFRLLTDRATQQRIRQARRTYTDRRQAVLDALRTRRIESPTRSGFNVWVPVPRETAVVAAMQASGWALSPGEAFRLESPPGIRITTSTLSIREADGLADDLADALRPEVRTYSG